MKFLFVLSYCVCTLFVAAQKVDYKTTDISLPPEIFYFDNQFSGLYIQKEKLFLLSESRLQDKAEGKIYSIKLSDLELKFKDTSFILPFKKIPIYNLEVLKKKMKANGDEYEGLEAMIINKRNIYFSVETTTASNNCYLLKGSISDTAIFLDVKFFKQIIKPLLPDGKHIYNAGFEALARYKKSVLAFFEFNYFAENNLVKKTRYSTFKESDKKFLISQQLPFRLTDITAVGKRNFVAINYFYNGGGEDEIYRIPANDSLNYQLIHDSSGFKSYTRLVSLKYNRNKFFWQPLWEFPNFLRSYNWEGIAAYNKGFFIINDKYTPTKPYKSVLMYISPLNRIQ